MKTQYTVPKTTFSNSVTLAFALLVTMAITVRAAEISPPELTNRAVAASPSAPEQFPRIARHAPTRTEAAPLTESALSVIKKNRALASSPRMREQFPELARGEQSSTVVVAKSSTGESQLAAVLRNHALAASPRMKEQFPELARGYTPEPARESLAVAPLK